MKNNYASSFVKDMLCSETNDDEFEVVSKPPLPDRSVCISRSKISPFSSACKNIILLGIQRVFSENEIISTSLL